MSSASRGQALAARAISATVVAILMSLAVDAMGMTVLLMLIHSNSSSLLQKPYMFSATSTDRG